MYGVKCEICQDVLYYDNELVFLLGDDVVFVSEQYPDWNRALCITCAEEENLN